MTLRRTCAAATRPRPDPVDLQGRRQLRYLGRLRRVEPAALRHDGLDGLRLHDDHAVDNETRPGLRRQRSHPAHVSGLVATQRASRAAHLRTLVHEDVDEADAHPVMRQDIAHAGGRRDARDDQVLRVDGREDLLRRQFGLVGGTHRGSIDRLTRAGTAHRSGDDTAHRLLGAVLHVAHVGARRLQAKLRGRRAQFGPARHGLVHQQQGGRSRGGTRRRRGSAPAGRGGGGQRRAPGRRSMPAVAAVKHGEL